MSARLLTRVIGQLEISPKRSQIVKYIFYILLLWQTIKWEYYTNVKPKKWEGVFHAKLSKKKTSYFLSWSYFNCLSLFREKFLLGKRCRFHCSWKLVALALTVLTLILSSVIAYFGGKWKRRKPVKRFFQNIPKPFSIENLPQEIRSQKKY